MQGNRGKPLEDAVNQVFKRYEVLGVHCQQNHAKQAYDGTYLEDHGFDFQCGHQGRFMGFDAKICSGQRWNLKTNAKLHQLKALLTLEQNGFEGFFLVLFIGQGLNRLNASYVQQLLIDGIKSVEFNKELETTIDVLGLFDGRPSEYNQGRD